MIFVEFRAFQPTRKFKCRECARTGKFDMAYHLPKGRYPGDKSCTVCGECFDKHVMGSCHAKPRRKD